MSDEPVRFDRIAGAPTPENLRFKENWIRSGDFHRALRKTHERQRDHDRARKEKALEDARYLARDGMPVFFRHRVGAASVKPLPGPEIRYEKPTGSRWVEVRPGTLKLVLPGEEER